MATVPHKLQACQGECCTNWCRRQVFGRPSPFKNAHPKTFGVSSCSLLSKVKKNGLPCSRNPVLKTLLCGQQRQFKVPQFPQFPCINKALKAFHVRSLVQFKGRGAMRLGWSTAGNPIRFGEGFCRLKKSLCNAPKASEGAGSIWKYHVPKTLGDVIRKTWKF